LSVWSFPSITRATLARVTDAFCNRGTYASRSAALARQRLDQPGRHQHRKQIQRIS
jgi:hypothetical protein